MTPIKQQLNVEEAADLVGVTTRTVYSLIQKGEVECKMVGRRWRVSRRSILDHYNMADPALKDVSDAVAAGFSGLPSYLGLDAQGTSPVAQAVADSGLSKTIESLMDQLSRERESSSTLMASNADLRVSLAEAEAREREALARAKASEKAASELRGELDRLRDALYGSIRDRRDREVVIG